MRRPRLKMTNGIYHCISRITGGRYWLTDECKEMWCDQLRRVGQFCGVEVLTYAVLDNHFHLLVHVPPSPGKLRDEQLVERYRSLYPQRPKLVAQMESTLSEGGTQAEALRSRLQARMHDVSMFLKELKQRFTMWFNARFNLYGTIWAERFKSILVEDDTSVLRIIGAYIDLNPLRAGIVKKAGDYRWCGMAAAERGDRWAQAGLISIVRTPNGWSEARSTYLRFVCDASLGQGKAKSHRKLSTEDADNPIDGLSLMTRQRLLSEAWIVGSRNFVQEQWPFHGKSMARTEQARPPKG